MILVMKKSKADYKEKLSKLQERRGDTPDDKLEYFRKLILDHLDTLEDDDGSMAKGGKGLPVGTTRDRKGGFKYIKTAPGKWVKKYDSHSRGAKMAVSAIKKKVAAAKDAHEMMQVVLENRDRFSDKNGQPLPFVQELSKYVSETQESREKAEQGKRGKDSAKPSDKKPQGTGKEKENAKKGEGGEDTSTEESEGDTIENMDERLQEKVREKLETLAEPMQKADFTRKEYNRLFPEGKVKTPLEEVKLGENQFAKLEANGREKLLGAMYQTLTDPVVVLPETREGEDARIYIKSFREPGSNKKENVISVVVDVDGKAVSISTGKRKDKQIEEKIKTASIPLYLKGEEGGGPTIGTGKRGPVAQHLEPSGSASQDKVSSESSEKSSDFDKIRGKYQSAKAIEGDEDEIQAGKETIAGKWKLVEADTPAASHDETTFHKTPGFPANEDGSTINDRDYEKDKAAQEAVLEIASDYDAQALSFDSPVVVTGDGVVISGNNRTMSSKIAARKGTDTKYIEALKKKAKKFGFTAEQVEGFKHPRVVFETAKNEGYSTRQFAKFNESGKKAMNPIESAVKVSKMIKPEAVGSIAVKIGEFDTLGELYADKKAVNEIFGTLQQDGIIGQFDRPQYVTEEGITGAGKEFLETVLIGSVINENNIRGLNREGCKSIRQKLVRAITPLIENKSLKGYSITGELNAAVDIAMQVTLNKDKFNSVEEYSKQQNMFGGDSAVSIELAKKLEGTQKEFAEFMQGMNGGLKYAANGEADIFLGGVESREDILSRMLNLKKSIGRAINRSLRFFAGLQKGHGAFEREKVVLNRAGESVEDYRWIAKAKPDVMLALEKQAIAPHAEIVRDAQTQKRAIAVDFDGVINSYKSGWKGPTETDEPVISAAESINGLWGRGYKIIIFSTRANTTEGVDTIREYLRRHTENNELADTIEITDRKPIADVYIDDRAIPFTGNWEETLEQIEAFKPWMDKSLTYSGHPLQGRTKVHGMDISIENRKGSTRSGTDKDGHEWHTDMHFNYGYIRGTVGVDKDHLDAYIGPNPESEIVYIVNQNDPVTGDFDEQKVMLGFGSEEEAKAAYLKQYDRPGFFGSIVKMDIDTFKEEAFDTENKGKPLMRRAA